MLGAEPITYLELDGQYIGKTFDTCTPSSLLHSVTLVAPILALIGLDVFFVEAFEEAEPGLLGGPLLRLLGRQAI